MLSKINYISESLRTVAVFCPAISTATPKCTALLSTIVSLLIASCHYKNTSSVNQALPAVKSICYCVRLNVPEPSLNRITVHGPTS